MLNEERLLKVFPWKFWLEVVGWLVVFFIVLEIFIRLFVFNSPSRVIDPAWGKVPSPNSCYRRGTEGFGITCYSTNGEIETPYHDGVPVVVLGDSYTEATQVDNSEKYVSLTESYLRERGLNVDLHNLGNSGLHTADYVYLAPLITKTFSPEVVVLQVNAKDFSESLDIDGSNYFEQQNGELALSHSDSTPDDVTLENIARSSSLLTYIIFRWSEISPKIVFDSSVSAKFSDAGALNGFGNPAAENISAEQIILQLNAIKRAYSASRIVILFIPNVPVVSDSGLSWTNPSDDYFLSTFKSIDGITVAYPINGFRALYEEEKILPRGFFNTTPNKGHINAYGHELVAKSLADKLEEILK